jgi:hypothetical protein
LELDTNNYEARLLLAKIYQYQNNRPAFLQTLKEAAKYTEQQVTLQNLIRLAESGAELSTLPFNLRLNVGRLD